MAESAGECQRVPMESPNPQLRAEALLQAGDLYVQANNADRALEAYSKYVGEFPKPIETAVETRSKIAEICKSKGDQSQYHHQLEEIVRADGAAGSGRPGRPRNVAARAAFELSKPIYEQVSVLKLGQPLQRSLQEKEPRNDNATQAFGEPGD